MVAQMNQRRPPFGLVVTGEAESWLPALDSVIGPQWVRPYRVGDDRELLDVIQAGLADAAVLDEEAKWDLDVLQLLRMIRRLDRMLPVVVVTRHRERIWLENALSLAAFSVVVKPLEFEELLRQIQRMMSRLDRMLREENPDH